MKRKKISSPYCSRKLWCFLGLMLCFMFSTAKSSATNDKRAVAISISVKNGTIYEVFKQIERQTDYRFFYDSNDVYNDQKITINTKSESIDEIMSQIVSKSDLAYTISERQIHVLRGSTEKPTTKAIQQKRNVTGVITSSEKDPLIGVSIIIKGTTTGTLTDVDGKYTIGISDDNTVLLISYVGFSSQEIKIGNRNTLDVELKEDNQLLDEVVVVGYAIQKKVNLTGSVTSVDFSKQSESRPLTTVSSALSGLSAGLQVQQTSGKPGGDGAKFVIRGVGSMNNSDPLIIIDGMPGVMDAVNPQDVASVTVLRDAASAAIYGSQAANGVILITTKKGNSDGKATIKYSANFSYNKATNLLNAVTNYADYMEWINESMTNVGQNPNFAQSTIDTWREASKNPNGLNEHGVPNYMAYPNTDWQKALFGTKWSQQHNLSVSGGAKNVSYLISTGYLKNPGLVENTGIERFNMRANLEGKITSWLSVGTNTYASTQDKDAANFDNANNFLRQTTPGLYPGGDGKYGYPEAPEESATANGILAFLNARDGRQKESRFNTTLYSKVKFMEGLSWDFNFNHQRRWDDQRTWDSPYERVKFSDGTVQTAATTPDQLSTSFSDYSNYQYTIENLLRYFTTINKVHDIGVLLGYNENYYYEQTNSGTKKGLIDASITTPGSATEMISMGGGALDRSSRSFFGRLNYAFKSRYLMEVNVRRDGHSRLDKNHRWGNYPSVSAAWRISEEDFMSGTKSYMDNLKLRVSWGKLGTTADIGPYESQSTYDGTNYSFGGIQAPGLVVGGIANSRLTWESVATTNFGIDANFLNNRLSFEADYFIKKTTDILYRPDIYLTMGNVTAPRLNIAEMTNKGAEFTLKWNDNIGDFQYAVSGNFSYIKNEVGKYKGKLQAGWVTDENGNQKYVTNLGNVSTGGVERILEGKSYQEYYLMDRYSGNGNHFNSDGSVNIQGGPKDGMIRTEGDMKWVEAMIGAGYQFEPNKKVAKDKIWYGDMIYADHNGDGIYGNSYDNKFQGVSRHPKINYGIQMFGAWKGFDLSLNWAGAAGFKLYWPSASGYNSTATRVGVALPKDIAEDHYFFDPTTPDDPRTNIGAKYPRLTIGESGSQNVVSSTHFLHNGSYFKLKNLTFGYAIPKKFAKVLFTQDIRVYFSGENLFTITPFPGQDPEMGAYPEYTSAKQFSFGVNVTF